MAYTDLTPDEQEKLDYFSNNLRALSGEFAQQINKIQAIKDYYDANGLSAILASLDNPDVIPNKTGLGGAVDMTKDEFSDLVGNLATLLSTYDTQTLRLARVKAAGINASL
jgi:hypothetical protein